jgi:hypothetical protein
VPFSQRERPEVGDLQVPDNTTAACGRYSDFRHKSGIVVLAATLCS